MQTSNIINVEDHNIWTAVYAKCIIHSQTHLDKSDAERKSTRHMVLKVF